MRCKVIIIMIDSLILRNCSKKVKHEPRSSIGGHKGYPRHGLVLSCTPCPYGS